MEKEKTAVVVDIGTSKIVAMAAKKIYTEYTILASETAWLDLDDPTKALTKRGVITNQEGVARTVADLLKRMNLELQKKSLKIERVYIGYGGQGLHTEMFIVERNFDGDTVMPEDIESINEQLNEHPNYQNIRKFVPEYFLDGELNLSPEGKTCKKLEARMLLIMGHKADNLKRMIENRTSGMTVEDMLVSPEGSAFSVLDERERTEGCALVEVGAGVTTVSIYHDRALRFMATIPLGGYAITKDVCSLKVPFDEAEEHKKKYGMAGMATENRKISEEEPTEEEKLQVLNNAISWRTLEIARNVEEQINESGLKERVRYIVLTGGSAALQGMDTVFENITGKKVRRAGADRTFVKQSNGETHQMGNSAVIGMFAMATEACCGEIEKETPKTPPVAPPKEPTDGKDTIRNIFEVIKKGFNEVTETSLRQSQSLTPKLSPEEKARRQADKAAQDAERAKLKAAKDEEDRIRREARKAERKAERVRLAAERAEKERLREIKRKEREQKRLEDDARKAKLKEEKEKETSFLDALFEKVNNINELMQEATAKPTSENKNTEKK
jgi:cell division protein FtsA